ncbi:hypothetical protein ASPCADRAFT_38142 [Aspergillus carbonarius ITEM 5010]|uniref:MARVEL domain-containing protein n=1 Tax=Aspergillus carbonarius (strain ITEM 5010) TaxID=602072 RepID=A0A1R3S0Y0_ASPC5|nr:hypothetical protein ASPCADRAFT_38142 [Aspergillus carbonarius ITEM 5010]
MGFGGVLLRGSNLSIRVLQFLDAAVILGIFSYFLAVLARHDQNIPRWIKATEGLSGAATLYGILGILFTCCLGGVAFFAFLAIVLDVCFIGAMIAIAIMTRHGTQSCSGRVTTPLGTGNSSDDSPSGTSYHYACELQKATFAVSIIGIFLFLISILLQILYARHHKREKRFGPSPANGYTSGTTRGFAFWRRNKNNPETASADDILPTHPAPRDVELGTTGVATTEKEDGMNGANTGATGGGGYFPWRGNASNGTATAGQNGTYGYGNSAYTGNY